MKIKTVKIGLKNKTQITIPYGEVSYIQFNGKDISECDVNTMNFPNFKICFHFAPSFFKTYEEQYEEWYNTDWYGVTNVTLLYENDTEITITLPWKGDDHNEQAEYNHFETTTHIEASVIIEIDKYNIYAYIDDDELSRYCQKIQHKFSTFECAVLVDRSKKFTIAEKHEMYRYIIKTMPDKNMKIEYSTEVFETSIHRMLNIYIDLQEELLDCLKKGEIKCGGVVYKNLKTVLNEMKSRKDEFNGEVCNFRVDKYLSDYMTVWAYFSDSDMPYFIRSMGWSAVSMEEAMVQDVFAYSGFSCPSPFTKGKYFI